MFSFLNVLNLLVRLYPTINLKVIFLNTRRIKSFFPFKDRLIPSQGLKSFTRQVAGIAMTST